MSNTIVCAQKRDSNSWTLNCSVVCLSEESLSFNWNEEPLSNDSVVEEMSFFTICAFPLQNDLVFIGKRETVSNHAFRSWNKAANY